MFLNFILICRDLTTLSYIRVKDQLMNYSLAQELFIKWTVMFYPITIIFYCNKIS